MDLSKAQIRPDMLEILEAVYKKLNKIEPDINESKFFERIFDEWLEPYKRDKKTNTVQRKEAVLKNKLETAFNLCGKSKAQVAREIGVNRVYLSQVIKGKYEPSVKVAFLIAESLGYPPERIKELFYLELVQE